MEIVTEEDITTEFLDILGHSLLTQNHFNTLTGTEKGRKKKRNASLLLKHGSTAQMEDVIEQIHS